MEKAPDFLTIDEVCKYLRAAKGTIYKYSKSRSIPCFMIGRQLRFRKEALDDWVKKRETIKPHKKRRRLKTR